MTVAAGSADHGQPLVTGRSLLQNGDHAKGSVDLLSDRCDKKNSYDDVYNKLRICVIINNREFKKDKKVGARELAHRTGTDQDRDALKITFEACLFDVRCHENLTDKQILKTLHKVAEEDQANSNCFVCCILSYGDVGVVFGANGLPVKIRSLTNSVKMQNCPTLEAKPKIFFIQACPPMAPQPDGGDHPDDALDASENGPPVETAGPVVSTGAVEADKDVRLIPNETDFLLGLCTKAGFVTAKSKENGSLYIQKLVKFLRKYGSSRDIVDILSTTNEAINQNTTGQTTASGTVHDLAMTKNTLRMKVRLAPSPKLDKVRLMIVGKSKRGKSSTANTILGENKFSVNTSFSQNLYSDWHQTTRDGRTIEITEMPTELDSDEAARPLITITPGPHVIILCFRCEQFFSPEDYFAYSTIKKWLGSHFSKYVILAFSGLDNANASNVEDILRTSFVSILRELPSQDRIICFNNAASWESRTEQGDRLLRLVDRVVQENGGGHFSNRKIREFEEEMVYQQSHGRSREEVKKRVVAGDDIEFVFEKRCCVLM